MNLKSAFSLLAAGTFLAACGADEVVNINDEAKEKATITLKMMDAFSGEPIDSVKVVSIVEGDENYTDSTGLSVWDDQVIGNHSFEISKKGYSTILYSVLVTEQGQGDVARVFDYISQVKLPKAGVTAKGVVLYPNEDGTMVAAPNVKVVATPDPTMGGVLNANYSFVPEEFVATTDKNGVYEFKDLPEGVPVSIAVGQNTIAKKDYAGANGQLIGASRAGEFNDAGLINMAPVVESIHLVNNNLKAISSVSTDLKLTFSANVFADSLEGNWSVTNETTNKDVLVKVKASKTVVEISPYSGKWDSTAYYSVSGTAYTADGESTAILAMPFKVGTSKVSKPANVTKLAVDPDISGNPELTWTPPKAGVSGYRLYYKSDVMAEFEAVSYMYTPDADDQDCTVPLAALNLSKKVEKITFILLTVNSEGVTSDMEDAKKVVFTIPED